ncbi:MAG: outer membrane beta-barrel protein [Ferruginibacter sp.]|nr:outer membrane beta-barrel protein [Chitinophagaceae bacterium]
MKPFSLLPVILSIFICHQSHAQELDKSATISLFTGVMNYQGDVKPDNFTIDHSNLAVGISIRKPLNRWFAVRGGVNMGKISAADRWNSEDLKARNLSFTTTIKEAYLGLEISVLDMSAGRFTPYVYGGIAVFHFNPWTNDKNGTKTFLKPLSTEGQGLSQYPDQKPYNLTQLCLPFGGGARFAVNDGLSVGVEFNQRKSFTDYIDDVSSHFVDRDALLQEKGILAVELAYRSDELPGGRPLFPAHGEKRGTPSQMDWYYFFGLTMEMKLSNFGGILKNNRSVANQRCPRNVSY